MTDAKDHAIIKAEYAEYRPVKTRGVLQIICEVPREQAQMVHRTFGEPGLPNQQIWVAIAKLNPETGKAKEAPKPKRERKDQTPSQHCATWCKHPEFQQWVYRQVELPKDSERWEKTALAEYAVRRLCGITRKRELNSNPVAAERWKRVHTSFIHRQNL